MRYRSSAAAMSGSAHQAKGIPCQDKVFVVRDGPVLACALADGAGSRSSSDLGAACITRFVSRLLHERFDELWEMPREALAPWLVRECITALEQVGPPVYELACTLLFFAGHWDGRFLSGHLGDGVQIHLTEAGELRVFSPPENGAYRNETYFITSDDAAAHLRLRRGVWKGAGALLLMSDGMADSLYNYESGTPAPACRTLAGWLREGEEDVITQALLKNMSRTFSRHTSDDMSLLLLTWQ